MTTRKNHKLIRAIRQLPEYAEWRDLILVRDVASYPKVPKNIQVHHIRKVEDILKQYGVESVEEAQACAALWELKNGVAITKGEHHVISLLERQKIFTKGFLTFHRKWLNERRL